mmetsp:Transcript_30319/g.66677  ORF Transcript_30319/g.66677 Transcript_30319/m.66677 type:complete len:427 (-) Transcript_30319:227-1507(-)
MNPDNAMHPNSISLTPEEMFHLQLRLQQQQGARNVTNSGSDGGADNAALQSSIFAPVPPTPTSIGCATMYPPYAGSVINVQPSMTAYGASLPPIVAQQQLLAPSFPTGMRFVASDAKFAPTASVAPFSSLPTSHLPISASPATDEIIRGLLPIRGKVAGKGGRQKKPKDMPKRPLSAYNLFFKDERERIVNSKDEPKRDDATGGSAADKSTSSASSSVSRANDKSSRRTPHGKIGFANLARIVGANWKKLSSDRLEHYQRLADKDTGRYKSEMELYHKVQESKRKKMEEEEIKQQTEEKRRREEAAQEKIYEELEEAQQQTKKRKLLATATAGSHTVAASTSNINPPTYQGSVLYHSHAPPSFLSAYPHAALQEQAVSAAYLSRLRYVLENKSQEQHQHRHQCQEIAVSSSTVSSGNNNNAFSGSM